MYDVCIILDIEEVEFKDKKHFLDYSLLSLTYVPICKNHFKIGLTVSKFSLNSRQFYLFALLFISILPYVYD